METISGAVNLARSGSRHLAGHSAESAPRRLKTGPVTSLVTI